jgi:hypothetical protein
VGTMPDRSSVTHFVTREEFKYEMLDVRKLDIRNFL